MLNNHMAQSAVTSRKEEMDQHTGVPLFWSRPAASPPHDWKKWIERFHMAASVKEGCDTRVLLQDPAETIPEPEPKPEQATEGEGIEAAAERTARNVATKRKVAAQNEEIKRKGPRIAHNVYFHEADTKVKARLYMALGEEGITRVHQKYPRLEIQNTTLKNLVTMLEATFKTEENTIYERFILFTRTQKQHESLELFYGVLTEQAAKCSLGTLEKELVRDLFIARNNNAELQKKFLIEKHEKGCSVRKRSFD